MAKATKKLRKRPPLTHQEAPCHDCGIARGELHGKSCDSEECPFCHHQLLSCNCCVTIGMIKIRRPPDIDPEVWEPTCWSLDMSESQLKRWYGILSRKGRIPFGKEVLTDAH